MLTMTAISPPRWPGEMSGTTLANQHNSNATQRSLLTTRKYVHLLLLHFVYTDVRSKKGARVHLPHGILHVHSHCPVDRSDHLQDSSQLCHTSGNEVRRE